MIPGPPKFRVFYRHCKFYCSPAGRHYDFSAAYYSVVSLKIRGQDQRPQAALHGCVGLIVQGDIHADQRGTGILILAVPRPVLFQYDPGGDLCVFNKFVRPFYQFHLVPDPR